MKSIDFRQKFTCLSFFSTSNNHFDVNDLRKGSSETFPARGLWWILIEDRRKGLTCFLSSIIHAAGKGKGSSRSDRGTDETTRCGPPDPGLCDPIHPVPHSPGSWRSHLGLHGGLCPGILGASPGDRLYAVCETRKCAPDPIQVILGCTAGNKGLLVLPIGRFALTLNRPSDGPTADGVRVYVDLSRWRSTR